MALLPITIAASQTGHITHTNRVHKKANNVIDVTVDFGSSDPFGADPVAACAAATTGSTVFFPPGTYTPPAGVGNGYTITASGVKVVFSPGVTINVSTWGACGLDLYGCSDVIVEGKPTITYTGTRSVPGTSLRGSALYINGCGVFINRDRCRIDGLRTINMSVGVTLSSYNGTGTYDREGVGNIINDLEVEGANFGVIWTVQRGLRINNMYVHDDIDDSAGANPTHAYYASPSTTNRCTDLTITNVMAQNINTGQAFQLKYCDNVQLKNHMARDCAGLFNVIDCNQVVSDGMSGINMSSNAGNGLLSVQQVTTRSTALLLKNTLLVAASGLDERMVSIVANDTEVDGMMIITQRPGTPANADDYDFVIRGDDCRYRNITLRQRGGKTRAFSVGFSSITCNDVTLEDFLCEGSRGLADVLVGSTGVHFKYSPGIQQAITAGTNYIGTQGGAAGFDVQRAFYERLYTVSGSATITPNPYMETRTALSVTTTSGNVVLAAPSGGTPPMGTTLEVVISNASGGTILSVTWNAAYVFSTTYTKPAAGAVTVSRFRHNGTSWVEEAR